jgi:hypothetical protein
MGVTPPGKDTGQTVARTTVMVNVVTAYERVHFTLDREHLTVQWPVTLLGVVPVGIRHYVTPLSAITGMRLVRVLLPSRLLVAGLGGLLLVALDLPGWLAGLVAAVSLGFVLLGVVAAVRIEAESGSETIPVCYLQRRRVAEFIARVPVARPGPP